MKLLFNLLKILLTQRESQTTIQAPVSSFLSVFFLRPPGRRASESLVTYSKHCSLIDFMCQALKSLHLSLRNACKLLKSLQISTPPPPPPHCVISGNSTQHNLNLKTPISQKAGKRFAYPIYSEKPLIFESLVSKVRTVSGCLQGRLQHPAYPLIITTIKGKVASTVKHFACLINGKRGLLKCLRVPFFRANSYLKVKTQILRIVGKPTHGFSRLAFSQPEKLALGQPIYGLFRVFCYLSDIFMGRISAFLERKSFFFTLFNTSLCPHRGGFCLRGRFRHRIADHPRVDRHSRLERESGDLRKKVLKALNKNKQTKKKGGLL